MKIIDKDIDSRRLMDSKIKSPTLVLGCLQDIFRGAIYVKSKKGNLHLLIDQPLFLYDLMKSLCFFVDQPEKEVRVKHHIGFSYCNDPDSEMPIFVKDGEDFILSESRLIFVKPNLDNCSVGDSAYNLKRNDTFFELIDLFELPRRRVFYGEGGIINTYDFEAPYVGHNLTLEKITTQKQRYKEDAAYVRKPMKEMVRESLICFAENIIDLEKYDWIWSLEYIQEALANYQRLKAFAGEKGWLEGIELRDFNE